MASNALRWGVRAPHGRTVYLTGSQRALLWYLRRSAHRGRALTLEQMAEAVGTSSRGRVWHQLRRLRQLELVGARSWAPNGKRRGRLARFLLWIPAAARAAYLGPAPRGGNDSVSTPPGFISPAGVRAAWVGSGAPPFAAGPPRLSGPRRGHPPRVVYARCPAGHRLVARRSLWTRDAGRLVAEWTGFCRSCSRPVVERVDLRLAAAPARALSPAELADPATLEARRRLAAQLLEDGTLPAAVRERLTRDYLEPRQRPS